MIGFSPYRSATDLTVTPGTKDSAMIRPFIASDQRRWPVGSAKTSIRLTDSKWCSRWTPNHTSHENYKGNAIADHLIGQKVGAVHRVWTPLGMQAILRRSWHVVRCSRVSGLMMRLATRRGPVWRCADQIQLAYAGSNAQRCYPGFSNPVSLTVCPYTPPSCSHPPTHRIRHRIMRQRPEPGKFPLWSRAPRSSSPSCWLAPPPQPCAVCASKAGQAKDRSHPVSSPSGQRPWPL